MFLASPTTTPVIVELLYPPLLYLLLTLYSHLTFFIFVFLALVPTCQISAIRLVLLHAVGTKQSLDIDIGNSHVCINSLSIFDRLKIFLCRLCKNFFTLNRNFSLTCNPSYSWPDKKLGVCPTFPNSAQQVSYLIIWLWFYRLRWLLFCHNPGTSWRLYYLLIL